MLPVILDVWQTNFMASQIGIGQPMLQQLLIKSVSTNIQLALNILLYVSIYLLCIRT